jgi:hypothetical protein
MQCGIHMSSVARPPWMTLSSEILIVSSQDIALSILSLTVLLLLQ